MYNGWRNYETWSVGLILDNDQTLHRTVREETKRAWRRSSKTRSTQPDLFTRSERAVDNLREELCSWVEDAAEKASGVLTGPLAGLWQQLLAACLKDVDWSQLAGSYLE